MSQFFHIRWPKYWNFSFSISPSNEYSVLISFSVYWLISLQSKGLSSLLQHHSSKASILRHSAFFIVQLSHPYMTTRKTIDLTRQTFVGTRKKEWGKMLLERRCLFQKVKKKVRHLHGSDFKWLKRTYRGFFSSLSHGNAVSCSRDNQYQLSFMYSSKTVLCI